MSPESCIVLLIARLRNGSLKILVHPSWDRLVHPADQDYFQAILIDFKKRALFDPEGLLTQASELSVGPLITRASGPNLCEYPTLSLLGDSFIEP